MIQSKFIKLTYFLLSILFFLDGHAQSEPTKVSVSLLYTAADVGIFIGIEKGYFKDQGISVDLNRMTSAADAIALLATDKLDVGSGSFTPGLLNALKRGVPIQIVTEKSNMAPPAGPGSGGILVRNELKANGTVKTIADLKGRKIAVNSLQSTSLNYVMRGLAKGGLTREDVVFVEMPFSQFIPALEKKAVDAVMVYNPLLQTIDEKMKLASNLPEADLDKTSKFDTTNLMFYSDKFSKSQTAKSFMIAHLKAQRDFLRMIQQGNTSEACRIVNKYVPAMPVDCGGMVFGSLNSNGEINIESLERYQKEWLQWGVVKDSVDIRKSINYDFIKNANSVLGIYK